MKAVLKRAYKGFLAAVSSPTVVQSEKNTAIFVVTRVLAAVGGLAGSAVVINEVTKLIMGA